MNNAAPKSPGEAGWIARSACADMLVYLTASWVHKSVIEPEVRFRPSAKSHPEGFDQGLRSHFWGRWLFAVRPVRSALIAIHVPRALGCVRAGMLHALP